MKNFTYTLFVCFCTWLLFGCQTASKNPGSSVSDSLSWEEIEAAAKGSTVHLMMWQGDPQINAYINEFVAPQVKARYDIELKTANGQGNVIVSALLAEMEAGKSSSELDLVWINGETFFQLRQINGLYGPWTGRLPNAAYLDLDNPFIRYDFQQETDGYECPWGTVQQLLIYDSLRTPAPPRTRQELEAWVKAHPGKFTIPNEFTGMSSLKALLADFGGGRESLNGPFSEEKYIRLSTDMWAFLNQLRPYFWQKGETFPAGVAPMHQMFASGELDFTLSMNDCEVDNKIRQGVFPASARAYVPDFGSIRNAHYLGIPAASANKAAAMVVANFMISPEAQLQKRNPEVWGDGTILNMEALPADWQEKFSNQPGRKFAPEKSQLLPRAIQEPAPEYMIRLYEDFRTHVIETPVPSL